MDRQCDTLEQAVRSAAQFEAIDRYMKDSSIGSADALPQLQ